MKYIPQDTTVTFSEIPDEISLCINISGCPCRCSDCHSKYLWNDIGEILDYKTVKTIIEKNSGISCVCFMGGDADPVHIDSLARSIRTDFPDLKIAWYSGRPQLSPLIDVSDFDYIKIGPYIKECGSIDIETTNQRLYRIDNKKLIDITKKFWTK